MNENDVVASWEVALSDGVHKIDFEHGTTTGKRVLWIDEKEIIRKDWMFKLVGKEEFVIGKKKIPATVNIDACSGFAYEYTLNVNGKSLKKFCENQSKTSKAWTLVINGVDSRIVLEKDSMDVWCNGEVVETFGEFTEDGTETHFQINDRACYIKAISSGNRREGIVHILFVNNRMVPDSV